MCEYGTNLEEKTDKNQINKSLTFLYNEYKLWIMMTMIEKNFK